MYLTKGKGIVLLGDFNARVGKSTDVDDVIGIFGEDTCNRSGNKLISFLNELELVILCNGRRCVSEPEWTRVRPSLDQKSVIDYNITDAQLLRESGDVCIDSTDIGMSDYFLVWLEQQRFLGNRSVQLDGGVLISLVMMLLEKSIVKHYRQRLRPFQRELVRWRKEE